jgi:hypothetical protein
MAELVKLRLPNGRTIERPRKIAQLFIRGGAEEILPARKPIEVGTKTTPKTPPPIILKEPEGAKPDDYPQFADGSVQKVDQEVKTDKPEASEETDGKQTEGATKPKSKAKKKSTKKTKK